MRGPSCRSKNLIQVTQIRDTIAMAVLNWCAKSCFNNPNRNLINTRNSSSMGCNAHALGLVEVLLISLQHKHRWHTRGSKYVYRYITTSYNGRPVYHWISQSLLSNCFGQNAATAMFALLQVATHQLVTGNLLLMLFNFSPCYFCWW